MNIAFLGRSGAGKDFLASELKHYGYTRLSFSDQLKKCSCKVFDWLDKDYPPIKKEQSLSIKISETGDVINKTPRDVWLAVGKLREIEPNIFIRMLSKEYFSNKEKWSDDIVITDVRTQAEMDWCRSEDFTFVFIEPSKNIYPDNDFDSWVVKQKDNCDIIFKNDFDLSEKEIEVKIEELLERIRNDR